MAPRRLLVLPGALAALLVAPTAVAQQAPPDFKTMFVKYGKKTVQATLGSYCHPNAAGSGECANAEYPLKGVGTLTVRAGGEVTLLTRATVSYVAWRAARVDGTGKERITALGEARAVTKTFRRWKFKLPRNLSRSTDLLGFDINYPHAYSSFEVGVKVLKAARATKRSSSRR